MDLLGEAAKARDPIKYAPAAADPFRKLRREERQNWGIMHHRSKFGLAPVIP